MTFITKVSGKENTYKVNGKEVTTGDYSILPSEEKKVFEKYLMCAGKNRIKKSVV